MRTTTLFIITCLLGYTTLAQGQSGLDRFLDKTDAFFGEFVQGDQVDYNKLSKNPDSLNELIDALAELPVTSYSMEEQKALKINAYNLFVVHGIIQKYPVRSPMEIPGFFDRMQHVLGSVSVTLNELEKKDLIKATGDARLHFVLVCGALDCPPISNVAYRPGTLDKQLDQRTRRALDDPSFLRIDHTKRTVALSQIFEWYAGDFKKQASTVSGFINKYRTKALPSGYKQSFYNYDWSLNTTQSRDNMLRGSMRNDIEQVEELKSNVQTFTPSILLSKGQFEVNNLNNLYVQDAIRNRDGDEVGLTEQQTFLTNLLQVTYGVSKNSKVNIGVDVVVNSAYYDAGKSSPLNVLSPNDEGFSRTALSAIGPRVKFTPFSSFSKLSVQSTFTFPVEKDLESSRFTAHDRYNWNTQFFYDLAINSKLRLFLEADVLYRIKRNEEQLNFIRTPLTSVFSYFPEKNTTLYALFQHSPAFGRAENGFDSQFGQLKWFSQYGVGGKYQVSPRLGFELSASDFFLSRGDGAGQTYNIGFRYIH